MLFYFTKAILRKIQDLAGLYEEGNGMDHVNRQEKTPLDLDTVGYLLKLA